MKLIKQNSITEEGHLPSDIVCIHPYTFKQETTHNINEINKKWFINLTNEHIPIETSSLLQLGEKFNIPSVVNKRKAICEFIKDVESNNKKYNMNNQITIRNTSIPLFHNFIQNKTKPLSDMETRILKQYNKTLKFTTENPNIIYTRADKGNITVALNKDSYIRNIEDMLKDESIYTIIKKNPATKIEKNLNNMLKKWKDKEFITGRDYYIMRSSDSILPKAYGLPKIHKEGNTYRIVVSTVNTALYRFAGFLQKLLKDNIPVANSHVNNSFELFDTLSNRRIEENIRMASFDVISLFTNIPLNLAIQGIRNRWQYLENRINIPIEDLIKAIELVLTSTYFTFNDRIYKQTYGTPMGSPLSPIIADIVMQDLETSIISNLNCHLSFYYRYVDDIILAAHYDDILKILDAFNNYHEKLKFTHDMEKNNRLSFLDLEIIVHNGRIIIDWFHKKTDSGRTLSFFSNHPIQHKIGTIYGFIDRALMLSHHTFHKKNIEYVVNVLLENNYPLQFIFKHITNRLIMISRKRKLNSENESTNQKKKNIVVIPHIPGISNIVNSTIDKNNFMIGYRCLNKLDNIIKVQKDKNKRDYNNNVVYKINCKDCSVSYVGQTKRQLSTRIKEHKCNIKLDVSKHNVITEHILQNNHSFDWENARILDKESNYNKRLISEMINIKKQEKGINHNRDTEMLDTSYFDIIKKLK